MTNAPVPHSDLLVPPLEPGVFPMEDWGAVCMTGRDLPNFLQRLSTIRFEPFDPLRVPLGALLNAKSVVLALGFFEPFGSDKTANGIRYWMPRRNLQDAMDHLEKFHFAEDFQQQVEAETSLVAVSGWTQVLPSLPRPEVGRLWSGEVGGQTVSGWEDASWPDLLWLAVPKAGREPLLNALQGQGAALHGATLFEYYRSKYALVEVGRELSERTLILETGLDHAVDSQKGC